MAKSIFYIFVLSIESYSRPPSLASEKGCLYFKIKLKRLLEGIFH